MIFKISVNIFDVQHCAILCNSSFRNVSVCLTLFPLLPLAFSSCSIQGKGLFSSDPIWIMTGAICLSTLGAAFSGNHASNTVQLSYCCPLFFRALFTWAALLAHCFVIIWRPDTFYLRLLLLIFFLPFLSLAGLNLPPYCSAPVSLLRLTELTEHLEGLNDKNERLTQELGERDSELAVLRRRVQGLEEDRLRDKRNMNKLKNDLSRLHSVRRTRGCYAWNHNQLAFLSQGRVCSVRHISEISLFNFGIQKYCSVKSHFSRKKFFSP